LWGESKIAERQREKGRYSIAVMGYWVLVWLINFTVRQNIFDGCGRIILDHEDGY
jgi:hypothetical protein